MPSRCAYEEFRGRHDDEAPLAGEVAAHYGARHTIRTVTHAEFRADLPKIFDAMDQPTIDGINTWFVAKAARELGLKVAISGLGGDELVGGYPSFDDIPRWVRWVRWSACVPFAGEAFRRAVSAVNDLVPLAHPKIAGVLKYAGTYAGAYLLRRGVFMPWELPDLMDRKFIREGLRRLDPVKHIAAILKPEPRTAWGKVAALEVRAFICATSCCAIPIGPAWRIRSKCAFRSSMRPSCKRWRRISRPAAGSGQSVCSRPHRAPPCRTRSSRAPRPDFRRRSSAG